MPGPEYWKRMTGYFLLASKSTGFTIQPSSFTPSEVVKEKVSRLPQLYFRVFSSSCLLSSNVLMSLPLLLRTVKT
ncbi:Uncharacterised protein [Segatella copri]|nr:Uncharacterised protein [Segatella copri]